MLQYAEGHAKSDNRLTVRKRKMIQRRILLASRTTKSIPPIIDMQRFPSSDEPRERDKRKIGEWHTHKLFSRYNTSLPDDRSGNNTCFGCVMF